MSENNSFVISLGGSLICPQPGTPNHDFINQFKNLLIKQLQNNSKFFLVTGGGATCRSYNQCAKEFNPEVTNNDLDWMGITASHLNAHLIKIIWGKNAHSKIITNPTKTTKFTKHTNIIVAGGWKPGWSTDYVAVQIAKTHNIKTIINLSNIDHVYSDKPENSEAKPITHISWPEFRKITGTQWIPGLNLPFDPIASQEAERLGLQVIILNGNNIENIEKYFNNTDFIGTTIQ